MADGVKILLVEDNRDEEFLAMRVLKKFPALTKVDVARNGVDALSYFDDRREGLPRLVLLDLKLPKIDGVDVLRELRSREETRTLPIVVLSSSDHDRDISRCTEVGADSYLTKPLEPVTFGALLERLGIVAASR